MYQQPPELGGALEDEKRAELPEQSMFELDGEDHTKARGFYEPAKEPTEAPENEIDRESKPIKRPVSPLEGDISPVNDEVSPSIESAKGQSAKQPAIRIGPRANRPASALEGVLSRFNEEISPIEEPTGLASRTKPIRDKALPPKPPLDG